MSAIAAILAREIIDSRGNPTVGGGRHPGQRRAGPRRGAVRRLDRRTPGGGPARQHARYGDEGGARQSPGEPI